ncbi:ADP-ribosylglycohydrolase family protein [Faecalicoccus pleomorphus]|uniref:ADP-ribosylglycohydrolase family protein n=1 Tax=Faecalicoccus pleomorphus TaxID=1323 RepID=UPI00242ABEB0|nr:ADP-ribosylglycohydrolase family protein [Faecalicoccus pleomorphus]
MAKNLKSGILGCLYAGGLADAMGGATEALSIQEILDRFGGWVEDFEENQDSIYFKGNFRGEVTDDTSQMYEMAKMIVEKKEKFSVEDAACALVKWSESYPKYYPRNAGGTTRYVIDEFKNGKDPIEIGRLGGIYRRGTTNGAAMRIAPAGLMHPGNIEDSINLAIVMTQPTHGTQHAYAGAAGIAAGISEALVEDATIMSVVKSCIKGIKLGYSIGNCKARQASGLHILPKVFKGLELALDFENMEDYLRKLDYFVGNDGTIQSSVAAAISIFVATDGDPVKTAIFSTNLGGDTDTIGCIANYLSGAYAGIESIPVKWIELFKEANEKIDFDTLGDKIYDIVK